jgi:hypothetical protein
VGGHVLFVDGVEHRTSGLIYPEKGEAVKDPGMNFLAPVRDNAYHDL